MRPGHRAERQGQVGRRTHGIVVTVGAADEKGRLWHALVAPRAEQCRKAGAVEAAAAFVESDDEIGRASCRERVCQYVSISVVAVSLNKKKINTQTSSHNHRIT